MTINNLIKSKNVTKYRLAKETKIPYSTLTDICNGKTQLEKCSAKTVYSIAKALGVTMESLLSSCLDKRIDFELFKSNTCHRLKELGDIDFLIELLEEDRIREYHKKKWYPESLYLPFCF